MGQNGKSKALQSRRPDNSWVEALLPSVMVFGDGDFGVIMS